MQCITNYAADFNTDTPRQKNKNQTLSILQKPFDKKKKIVSNTMLLTGNEESTPRL